MTLSQKQSGITLIELMIAMILGLLVSGAIITIFITNVKSATENIKMIHLNQELRTVMGFMSDELKRAGYSADPANTDFMSALDESTPNCLIYAYDVDGNGLLDVSKEKFGFRIESDEMLWGANADTNCTFGTAITDRDTAEIIGISSQLPSNCDISVYPLSNINLQPITAGTLDVQYISIWLTAKTDLRTDEVCRTVSETIRVRNEDAT